MKKMITPADLQQKLFLCLFPANMTGKNRPIRLMLANGELPASQILQPAPDNIALWMIVIMITFPTD